MTRLERLRKEIERRSKRSKMYLAMSLPCWALALVFIVLSSFMNDADALLCSAVLMGLLSLLQWSVYLYHQAVRRTLTILVDAEESLSS